MAITLKNLLPKILQTDFWNDFIDVISDELQNLKDEIAKKELFFDTRDQTDEDHLIELAISLGYNPDRSLDDTVSFLRRENESISFRRKYKSTYLSYFHIFRTIPYSGEVFIYFWNTTKLIKAFDSDNYTNLNTHDPSYPFQFQAELNYFSYLLEELYLDYIPSLYLDSVNNPWSLDDIIARISTKHLAIELVMDKLLIDTDNRPYGMLNPYMTYLLNAVEYNREVAEVPHCGVQVTGIMDDSALFDNFLHRSDMFDTTINLISDPEDLTTVNWNDSNTTRTTSLFYANDFPLTLITKSDTTATNHTYQDLTVGITEVPFQGIFKKGTGLVTKITLYDTVALSDSIDLDIIWATSTITLNTGTNLRYEWIDLETVWVSCISDTLNPVNNQRLKIHPGYEVAEGTVYATGIQLEDYAYPTPYIETTRNAVVHDFTYTLIDEFSMKIKLHRAWFPYDTITEGVIFAFYIDGTHYFKLTYDPALDKFKVSWIDGGIERTLVSQQFDDGTLFDDLTQTDIIFFLSIDLTTGDTSGSRFICITDEQTFENDVWSGNIDAHASVFPDIEVGSFNSGNNYINSEISYLNIYDGTITRTITDEDDLDDLLELATALYERAFPDFDYGTYYYSMPDIKLRSTLTSFYDSNKSIEKMVIGTGVQPLPGKYESGISYPLSLAHQIGDKDLHDDNKDESDADWILRYDEFQGNTVLNEIIDLGDGSNSFGGTLSEGTEILPRSLVISYISGSTTYTASDLEGTGIILGDGAIGSIDYDTKIWSLTTIRDLKEYDENLLTVAGAGVNSLNEFSNNLPIVINSVRVKFTIGGILFVGIDDGMGNITGTHIIAGSVVYATGEITITFDADLDVGNVSLDYIWTNTTTPTNPSNITADYSVVGDNLNITEVGLIDENSNLVAYMTFPPLKLEDNRFHAGFNFFYN